MDIKKSRNRAAGYPAMESISQMAGVNWKLLRGCHCQNCIKNDDVFEMYGFISGITDTDDITYCPKCGEIIAVFYLDGTARCDNCGFHFGVVECEDGE